MYLSDGRLHNRLFKTVLACLALSSSMAFPKSPKAELNRPVRFHGVGDASAAVAVGTRFFITASDEEHQLRVYNRADGGTPVSTFDLAPHMPSGSSANELDLEGGAMLGSRLFWISSHSRNQHGLRRPNREHLFAVELLSLDPTPQLKFVGRSYTHLLDDLFTSDIGKKFHLKSASKSDPRSTGGLNIEGMCSSQDQHLWIGFRTPIQDRLALMVEITNPNAIISGQHAVFGRAVTLDLDGLGIRDLAFDGNRHYIIAGAHDGKDKAALFRWSGRDNSPSPKRFKLPGLESVNPEAIAIFEQEKPEAIYLFTDSGRGVNRIQNPVERSFECIRIDVAKNPK